MRVAVAAACLVAGVALAMLAIGAQNLPLTYFIAEGDPTAGSLPGDHELAVWAFEAWARNSNGAIQLQATREQEALVRVYWVPANGSTYGETRPMTVAGRQGASVFVRPDVEALGPEIASRARVDPLWRDTVVYFTCLHEIGHALGLEHTADERDIMYFFGYGGDIVEFFGRYRRQLNGRSDIHALSGLSEADVARLRTLGQKG